MSATGCPKVTKAGTAPVAETSLLSPSLVLASRKPARRRCEDIAECSAHPGLIAALAGLQGIVDARKKGWFLLSLFLLSLAGQCSTQVIQYWNATASTLKTERATAFALFAYSDDNVDLLGRLVDKDPTVKYILGYRSFKYGKFEVAKRHLNAAIDEDSFVAQSNYLLGIINARSDNSNWLDTLEYLNAAINHDDKYAAAYYARAYLYLKYRHDPTLAIADLKRSVQYDCEVVCSDLLNSDRVGGAWADLVTDNRLRAIQE